MITIHAIVVKVKLVEDHITRCSHLERQVHSDVRKSKVTISENEMVSAITINFKKQRYLPGDIDRCAAQVVPLSDQRQGLALAELAATLLEKGGYVSDLPGVDDREKTITVQEGTLLEGNAFLNQLFLRCCHFCRSKFKNSNFIITN